MGRCVLDGTRPIMVTASKPVVFDPNATGTLVMNRVLTVLGGGVSGVHAVVPVAPKRH